MIVRKHWERYARPWFSPRKSSFRGSGEWNPTYLHTYTGWFFLGIIPVYIIRETEPLQALRGTM